MIPDRFEIARITVQTTSPFTVGTGGGDDLVDAVCVSDANGLPAIPGSSIAGVLRHALCPDDPHGSSRAREVFGFQERDQGAPSRLSVSWAHVHGSDDSPVPARDAPVDDDSLLRAIRTGIVRDHVRIDARGVVDKRGKYDERLVPTGARFTFEMMLDADAPVKMDDLVALLASPAVRIGGRTRRGFGAFEIVEYRHRAFDLRKHRKHWKNMPVALHEPDKKSVLKRRKIPDPAPLADTVTATLTLTPEDFFLFGTGEPWHRDHEIPDRAREGGSGEGHGGEPRWADQVPYTEPVVEWKSGDSSDVGSARGRMSKAPVHVIPATGVKGALRHRVAFHHRALEGELVGEGDAFDRSGPEADPAVRELFGSAREGEADGPGAEDLPGRLFLSDMRPKQAFYGMGGVAGQTHVSLDRFTQGPMEGMLFSEAPLYGPPNQFEVRIVVRGASQVSPAARTALRRALHDLEEGRLALGAGANRGHGYFTGSLKWSDPTWAQTEVP